MKWQPFSKQTKLYKSITECIYMSLKLCTLCELCFQQPTCLSLTEKEYRTAIGYHALLIPNNSFVSYNAFLDKKFRLDRRHATLNRSSSHVESMSLSRKLSRSVTYSHQSDQSGDSSTETITKHRRRVVFLILACSNVVNNMCLALIAPIFPPVVSIVFISTLSFPQWEKPLPFKLFMAYSRCTGIAPGPTHGIIVAQ